MNKAPLWRRARGWLASYVERCFTLLDYYSRKVLWSWLEPFRDPLTSPASRRRRPELAVEGLEPRFLPTSHFQLTPILSGPVAAGDTFSCTVEAEDSSNNPITGYSGSVTLASADPLAATPGSVGSFSGGYATASITFKTANATGWIITASATGMTGTSPEIPVVPAATSQLVLSAPGSAVTGSGVSVTVTAEDPYGNVTPNYVGTVHFTSNDSLATIANGDLPPNYTFTSGSNRDNGVHTFSDGVTFITAGADQTVTATDIINGSIDGTSGDVDAAGLQVDSITPTNTGFTVSFNQAFDPSTLNLYATGSGSPAVLFYSTNANVEFQLTGSVVPNASHTAFTFVETDFADQNGSLPNGAYYVSLASASWGLKDTNGRPLDASNSPDNADNLYASLLGQGSTAAYTKSVTVDDITDLTDTGQNTPYQVAVSLPAFAQGPGLAVHVQMHDTGGSGGTYAGIPATISDGNNATTVSFNVTYDTTMLTVTGAEADSSILGSYPDATFSRTTTGTPVNGIETDTFTFSTGTASELTQGSSWTLGDILASVPNTAGQQIYKSQQILQVTSVTSDGGSHGGVSNGDLVGGNGVEVVAYLGDTSGNGVIQSNDSTLASDVGDPYSGGGFPAFGQADPVVLADVDGAGYVDSTAVGDIALLADNLSQPYIPVPPGGGYVSAENGIGIEYMQQEVNYNATALVEVNLLEAIAETGETVTVDYSTSDGSAKAGLDYPAESGSLTFTYGQSSQTIAIPLLNHQESTDTWFDVALSDSSDVPIVGPAVDRIIVVNAPLDVVDTDSNLALPPASTGSKVNSFADWSVSLAAQDAGTSISAYQWSFANAPDAVSSTITGASSYKAGFTWDNFSGSARTDTVALTVTLADGEQEQEVFDYLLQATDSPSYTASKPTTYATWPEVIAPDQLQGEDSVPAGPYASVGLVDGAAETDFSLPSYNSNAEPLGLVYDSAQADPQPVFQVDFPLSTTSLPTSVIADLKLTPVSGGSAVYTLSDVYYGVTGLNPGDDMQIALQATSLSLSTGRYDYEIDLTATYSTSASTTLTGAFDYVTGSTSPDTAAANPFGAGWSLDNVTKLTPVSGYGVILQNPDGTSLWFADGSTSTTYTSSPGNFSTLSSNTTGYTLTQADGTKFYYNTSGQQTAIVDTNNNSTSFGYNSSTHQLTTVTDMNGQASSIAYASTGMATTISNPDSLSLSLSMTSGNLTGITDAGANVWSLGYTSGNLLTSLTDPRGASDVTSFTYNFAGQVSQVTQPDGSTENFESEQENGLAQPGTGSSTTYAKTQPAADADAVYTDGNNQTWAEAFDGLGFGVPVQTTNPLGNTALNYVNSKGLPWMTANGLGNATVNFYDSSGNVTTTVNPVGDIKAATYNAFGEALTQSKEVVSGGSTDTLSVTSTSYDSKGNPTTVVDADGHSTTNAFSSAGLLTSTIDGNGNTTKYSYNTYNQLTAVVEAAGALNYTLQTTYDSHGNVASTVNESGVTDSYAYDNMNDLTTATMPQSSSATTTYSYNFDAVGNQLSSIMSIASGVNATTSSAYDSMNRVTQATDAMGYSTGYGFDSAGNLTSVVDPLGYTTMLAYNAADELTQQISPVSSGSSATIGFSYDQAGQQTQVTGPMSQTTTYNYLPCGCLSCVTDSQSTTTTYNYYPTTGEGVTILTDASDNSVSTENYYDPMGLLTQSVDATGFTTLSSYDGDNNLTSVAGYSSNTSYTYSPLNQLLTQITDGATTKYAYNPVGNLTLTTDALGNTTANSYDQQGNLLTMSNADGATTYGYNLAGWQTSLTDPDHNTTGFAYNLNGWVTTTTNPNGHSATSSYDATGNLTSAVDANGQTTDYTYNYAGQQTGETWVGQGYSAAYGYDLGGDMTSASDNASTFAFMYNNGELTTTKVSYAGASGMGTVNMSYAYNFLGQRTSLSDNEGGSISYGYNDNLQLTSLNYTQGSTHANVSLSYDTHYDRQNSATFKDGNNSDTISEVMSFSPTSYSMGYSWGTSHSASYSYGLNADGQVSTYLGLDGSLTYGYDGGNQLTSVTGSASNSYSYDANGNLNGSGQNTTTGNELTSDGSDSYTYDSNGNLSTKTYTSAGNTYSLTYSWDNHNRLTQVVEKQNGSPISTEQMTYDVFGNLIGEKLGGTQQFWTVYDGDNPYMDFNGSGSLTMHYLTNPQEANEFYGNVAAGGSDPVNWYLTDYQGSIRAIVNQTGGSPSDTINYDAFGDITSSTGSTLGLFQGGEYDSNLMLYRFGARWQDPATGRWVSQDPMGFNAGDSNLYRYSNNEPTSASDPSGLDYQDVPGVAPEMKTVLQVTNFKWVLENTGWAIGTKGPYRTGDFVQEKQVITISIEVQLQRQLKVNVRKNIQDQIDQLNSQMFALRQQENQLNIQAAQYQAAAVYFTAAAAATEAKGLLFACLAPAKLIFDLEALFFVGAAVTYGLMSASDSAQAALLEQQALGLQAQANNLANKLTNGDFGQNDYDYQYRYTGNQTVTTSDWVPTGVVVPQIATFSDKFKLKPPAPTKSGVTNFPLPYPVVGWPPAQQ